MNDKPRVVAAVPGQGWVARYKVSNKHVPALGGDVVVHTLIRSPVVAWLVYEDGHVVAVAGSSDNIQGIPVAASNFYDLVPPDGWSAPEKEPTP